MDEFLDFLEFATTEEHNKREIWVVGRSFFKYEKCGERDIISPVEDCSSGGRLKLECLLGLYFN